VVCKLDKEGHPSNTSYLAHYLCGRVELHSINSSVQLQSHDAVKFGKGLSEDTLEARLCSPTRQLNSNSSESLSQRSLDHGGQGVCLEHCSVSLL
jgi:hypothetical protein